MKWGKNPNDSPDGRQQGILQQDIQALMKQKDIHHFSTSGNTKARVVEWFNRTLKQCLYHYFTMKNTLNFVYVLQDLVKGYNRSDHRIIKMAPNQVTVTNSPEVWETLYGDKKRKIVQKTSTQSQGSCETE